MYCDAHINPPVYWKRRGFGSSYYYYGIKYIFVLSGRSYKDYGAAARNPDWSRSELAAAKVRAAAIRPTGERLTGLTVSRSDQQQLI